MFFWNSLDFSMIYSAASLAITAGSHSQSGQCPGRLEAKSEACSALLPLKSEQDYFYLISLTLHILILTLFQKESCGTCQGTGQPFPAKNEHTLGYVPTLPRNPLRAKVTALAKVEVKHLAHIILWAQEAQSDNLFPYWIWNKHLTSTDEEKGNN